MREVRNTLLLGLLLMGVSTPAAAETGEELFKGRCAACHTVGEGRLIGPDLDGLAERRELDWIVSFVQSSQKLIASGDADAVAVYEEYNKMAMPDQPLNAAQVTAIVEFTKTAAKPAAKPAAKAAHKAGGKKAAPAAAPAPQKASQADIELGQALFQGTTRLENEGPTCNACHDVTHDAVIGGGVLAKELTTVFSRLGGPGVRAILGAPPFPVMQQAYKDRPLTDREVVALVAFLEDSDREKALQQPRDYGPKLAASGAAGTALLLGLYTLLWKGRRRESVNQSIYDRQIKSSDL